MGGEERLRRALEKLELLVCVDLYRNATGELAHVLLPAADMLERADLNLTGLGMQLEPWVQWSEALVAPRAERREEWWIFQRLAQVAGFPSSLEGPDPAGLARLDHMLAASGLSLEKLRASPHGLRLPPLAPGRFYADVIQTPERRVDCCPAVLAPALERSAEILRELEAEPRDVLKLIGRRDPWMHNSWYHNLPKLKRPGREENTLDMHPEDARARGLREGSHVRVTSAHGEVLAPLRLDASLRRGVVAMTHGWGHAGAPGMRVARRHPGRNANALLPSGPGSFEPVSNQAFMTGIPVRVVPAF
jgi:anaerobic selenocysteine-containing dehydrogenase